MTDSMIRRDNGPFNFLFSLFFFPMIMQRHSPNVMLMSVLFPSLDCLGKLPL